MSECGIFGHWAERPNFWVTTGEIKPDPKRLAYQTECKRIFSGLWKLNYCLNDQVGIRVNTPKFGNGLILRETFLEEDLTFRNQFVLNAFLVTEDAIYKLTHLTPKALEKTEKAEVDYRLKRLELVSYRIGLKDIFDTNKFWDGELVSRAIRESVKAAATKVSPEEYVAKLIGLN